MKAVVLEGPGVAHTKTVNGPPVAGPDEVLLRVRKVGLCGSDLNSFRGRNPLVSFPRILGHEVAATVAEGNPRFPEWGAGMDVTLSPGSNCGKCASCLHGRPNACQFNETMGVQRDGALTEFVVAKAGRIYRGDLSLKELCLVEPLTIGFHAVARGRVEEADAVAVFGCGGVGLGAVSGAAFRGAKVIGVDVDDAKLATAKKAGATEIINTRSGSLHEQLADVTDGHGPDVIIEAIGIPETYRGAVEEVAYAGRVVYIGWAKEQIAYETRHFVHKELDIHGSRNAQPEDFRAVIRMLEAKRFPVEEAVTHMVTMDETPEILAAWDRDPAQFTKIMVAIG